MKPKLILLIIIACCISCVKTLTYSKAHKVSDYSIVNMDSITKLDGKLIELKGFLRMDFENVYLEYGKEKIWLDFDFFQKLMKKNNDSLDGKVLKTMMDDVITVRGKYIIGKTGHLSAYNSKITDIVFVED